MTVQAYFVRESKTMKQFRWVFSLLIVSILLIISREAEILGMGPMEPVPGLKVYPSSVNRVTIGHNGHLLAVYAPPVGSPEMPEKMLLTHARRDVTWPVLEAGIPGLKICAPTAELAYLQDVEEYWVKMAASGQFHDYAQQSTKILTAPLDIDRPVQDGDIIQWQGLELKVLSTPGYTRGAVSYLTQLAGRKICFTGDLISGDGQLLDLYSLQDAVPGTRIRGYHGYAGRIGDLMKSLRKIREQQCDLLVPSRGPYITNPEAAVEKLITSLENVYANYLSINAGRWYFKDDYDILSRRALGSPDRIDWMPWAETIQENPPKWIKVIKNSRLMIAEDGSAFLIDCGSEAIFEEVKQMQSEGTVNSVEGLFITHYHDDHTDFAARAASGFGCPVYATEKSADILENPQACRLPALTPNPIPDIQIVKNRQKIKWKEFILEFFYFPGQTIYHDAMLVTSENGEKIFFIGDSFSPSGIDDYCLLNRNLLHDDMGYFYCLDLLDRLPEGVLLINQHIVQPFAFTREQVDLMRTRLKERRTLLAELLAWDDPNYGIDEQWVRFHPYSITISDGNPKEASIRIFNHSPGTMTYRVKINTPAGLEVEQARETITVPPRQEKSLPLVVRPGKELEPPHPSMSRVLTADIGIEGRVLGHWCEALVRIKN